MSDHQANASAAWEKFVNFASQASQENFKAFSPRPDDVIIVGIKSGSTWLQQIVHSLRTRGSTNFEDINRVIPCLELAYDDGIDLDAEEHATARCFKTHLAADVLPRGPKYIVALRNPKDMVVSFYDFMRGWTVPSDLPIDVFAQTFLLNRPHTPDGIWPFPTFHDAIAMWWPLRNDPRVLLLHYEDLKADLRACVKLITEFMGLDANDEALIDIATQQASLDYMKENTAKYHTQKRNGAYGEAKVTKGPCKVNVGSGNRKAALPSHIVEAMDADWKEVVQSATGLESYEKMRGQIHKELNRPSSLSV